MKTKIICVLFLSAILIASACKKKKDEDPQPYSTFKIGALNITYNSHTKFGKFCVLSKYCGAFQNDGYHAEINNIQIGLPAAVSSGSVYHTGQSDFYFIYLDAQGNKYYSYYGGNMVLTVTSWEGNGGWVKGTFSGNLPSEANPQQDSVIIENGIFEGKIWYIE